MPRVSVWLIRAALLHLLSGSLLGASYLTWKAVGWPLFGPTHREVHVEQVLVGWMVQLVIGVAFNILPRTASYDPERDGRLMWVVFVLLNAGVLAAGLGGDPVFPRWLVPVGRVAETVAVVLFVLHAWNRQRPYRAGSRAVLV